MLSDPSSLRLYELSQRGKWLTRLWDEQREFNEALATLDPSERTQERMVETYALGLIEEISEVLRRVNWKYHRRQDKPEIDRVALADDLADLEKYVMCLWQLFGFDLDNRLTAIDKKTKALWQVIETEFSAPEPGQPVLVCDLDNTLAKYTVGFAEWMGRQGYLSSSPVEEFSSYQLHRLFDLDFPTYQSLKIYWERGANGGGYDTLQPYSSWVEAVRKAREQGCYLVLVTARPHLDTKQVWYDCWTWAKKHLGRVDRLLFCESGRIKIVLDYLKAGHPTVWLEDSPEYLSWLRDYGDRLPLSIIVHAQPYNSFRNLAHSLGILGDRMLYRKHTGLVFEDIGDLINDQRKRSAHSQQKHVGGVDVVDVPGVAPATAESSAEAAAGPDGGEHPGSRTELEVTQGDTSPVRRKESRIRELYSGDGSARRGRGDRGEDRAAERVSSTGRKSRASEPQISA